MDNGQLKIKENVIKIKSFAFALRVVKLYQYLQTEKKEFVLSKQLLRSGTAIGALVREAEQAESTADFVHKMAIALKEANETDYWIDLLHQANYLENATFNSIKLNVTELLKPLVSIIKTTKQKKSNE